MHSRCLFRRQARDRPLQLTRHRHRRPPLLIVIIIIIIKTSTDLLESTALGIRSYPSDSSFSLSTLLDVQRPKKPHIKKPLNAFMLYMKEQRARVIEECTLKESSAINKVLGQKWKELPRAEQDRYYGKWHGTRSFPFNIACASRTCQGRT